MERSWNDHRRITFGIGKVKYAESAVKYHLVYRFPGVDTVLQESFKDGVGCADIAIAPTRLALHTMIIFTEDLNAHDGPGDGRDSVSSEYETGRLNCRS